MAPAPSRWSWLPLVACAVFAAGCGDDAAGGSATGVHRLPVPGCEAIDPSPCDVFQTDCQTRLMDLAACMRGSAPQALPPVSRMTEGQFAQLLIDAMTADPPPPYLPNLESALVMLSLVAPGAFTPSSVATARAAQVWGFYRHDLDDIVLIDRGLPADDIEVVSVFLHELVHALQDREQDLSTWYDAHADTYDALLAAMSVVEGEARLHQQRLGVSLLGLDPNAVDLGRHFDSSVRLATEWVLSQPSPYLASYSAFPYEYGGRLLWPRTMQQGPQAIADLFAAPPAGTRVLLDPGNAAAVPAWAAPAAPTTPPEWVFASEGTLGAWGTYLSLARRELPQDAESKARRWRGDRLSIYSGGAGQAVSSTALVWRIAFADDATATQVAQRFLGARTFGSEVVIALSNTTLPLDWAFAAPAQSAPAQGDGGLQRAAGPSASEWLNRIFIRKSR